MITIKQATKNDLAEVANMMAVSFLDYPFMQHSFFTKNFSNSKEQLKFLEKMCSIYLKSVFKKVTILISVQESEITGLSILSPIKHMKISVLDMVKGGVLKLFLDFFKKDMLKFLKVFLDAAVLDHELINSKTWYLHIFAINPNYQGQQIGSKLMTASINYILKNGGNSFTTSTNTKPALAFYQKNKFEIVRHEHIFGHGAPNIDKFIIYRDLGARQ